MRIIGYSVEQSGRQLRQKWSLHFDYRHAVQKSSEPVLHRLDVAFLAFSGQLGPGQVWKFPELAAFSAIIFLEFWVVIG